VKPWLKKQEYELYNYLKERGSIDATITELSKTIGKDNADTNRRIKELERKGYIIRNGTYIKVL
jgi:DNA-binding MarR family transcriptional regulator